MNDYVLADELVFSDGGEFDIPAGDKFSKILNNSFCLTEEQFGTIFAIANGLVRTTEENVNITWPDYPNCYFFFQPAQKAREKDKPPFRDHILVHCASINTKRVRTITIRPKRGNASALDKVMAWYRPQHFIRDLMEMLSTGTIEEVKRQPPRPRPSKPHDNKPRQDTRTTQQKHPHRAKPDVATSAMGDHWPKGGKDARNPSDKKDRRHSND